MKIYRKIEITDTKENDVQNIVQVHFNCIFCNTKNVEPKLTS